MISVCFNTLLSLALRFAVNCFFLWSILLYKHVWWKVSGYSAYSYLHTMLII